MELLRDVGIPLFAAVAGAAGGAVFMRRKYNVDVFSGMIAGIREAQAFLRSELVLYREEIVMVRELLRKAEEIGRKAVEEAEKFKGEVDAAVEEAMRWRTEDANHRLELEDCKHRVAAMRQAFERGGPR